MTAALHGHTSIAKVVSRGVLHCLSSIQMLLDHRIDIAAADRSGQTALHWAATGEYVDVWIVS